MEINMKNKKGFIGFDKFGAWIIALAVLVIIVMGYFILKNYLSLDIGEYIKNLFKFRN